MSNSNTLERATGRLFTEMLPELAGINYGDTDGAAALALEIIRFTESDIHNPSSSNNLDFWGAASDIASVNSRNIFETAAKHRTVAVHTADTYTRPLGIENTGEGALLVTNGVGELVIAYLVRNQSVEELYGDMAHPITKKLVLAILAEKLTAQGADWGEGYRWMTAFLRENQLLKPDKLPAMGMATVHETEMTPENEGKPRGPMAYGAASSWIPTVMTTLLLMNLPSFREHYEASMKSGVLEIDWLAGFMDFTVARAAAELVVGRDLSTNFPNPIQTEGWFGLSHYQINAN